MAQVTVIGGGLAGSECALQLARRGISVTLMEMRPQTMTPAHHTASFAELVCSNSFKATRHDSAAGLLKEELRLMGSELIACADAAAVPAGGALAVDRERFSAEVEARIAAQPNITVERTEATTIPEGHVVIAAGPLCSPALAEEVLKLVGGTALSFFDAAAPSLMPPPLIGTLSSPNHAMARRGRAIISTVRSTAMNTTHSSTRSWVPSGWCSKILNGQTCFRRVSLLRRLHELVTTHCGLVP